MSDGFNEAINVNLLLERDCKLVMVMFVWNGFGSDFG